jgi:ATP-dependent Lhr-like helicase
VCQAIKRVLSGDEISQSLSKRGIQKLNELRDELPALEPGNTIVERLGDRSRWWTFAGARANWLLAQAVRTEGAGVRVSDFYIEMKGIKAVGAMRERLKALNVEGLVKPTISSRAIDLKFRDAVPETLLASIVSSRAFDRESALRVLTHPINEIGQYEGPTQRR